MDDRGVIPLHKNLLRSFQNAILYSPVYTMPALIGHASWFCGLYCTYGHATWGKSACTKLFIATLKIQVVSNTPEIYDGKGL